MAKKAEKKIGITVTGDVSIDWFEGLETAPLPATQTETLPLNWQTYPCVYKFVKLGGAPLLATFIQHASGSAVISHQLDELENLASEKLIQSYFSLGKYGKNGIYRVKDFKGHSGPSDGKAAVIPLEKDNPAADVAVLYDEGNGFRNAKTRFPKALSGRNKPLVIFRMSRPLQEGQLWDLIRKKHLDRTVLIIDADDLREQGVKISRRLSWERTAKDFVWQMASNPKLISLNHCAFLIVRFGLEGAILHSRKGGKVASFLFFDPMLSEDGFPELFPGSMPSVEAAFTAAIATALIKKGFSGIQSGVRQGLLSARKLWQLGFGQDPKRLDYPLPEIFKSSPQEYKTVAEVRIPNPTAPEPADPDFWCILDDLCLSGLEDVANNFVGTGKDPALDQIPIGQFRYLRTYDRSEIESFRGIKNLISEYLDSPGISRPLSIAVFGAPGSGKSFGVTEVAESVAPGRLKNLEFNLSQFNSTEDLVSAFHLVRDVALGGKIPIVFFDEFDSEFEGKLGWLKFFLAPMQDGKFRDGEAIHPIGRAIFVFAGGTCCSFSEFARENGDEFFKGAKGPDFLSRLRGYVNIKGPNPVGPDDRLFMVRRAIFLRFLLLKNAKNIFDSQKNCSIDPGVLRAMIKVPLFKHGVRSMQAIIEMSLLTGRKSFEQAALPSPEQLQLHVDAEVFSRLVVRDVLLGSAREILAKAIHKRFQEKNKDNKKVSKVAMEDWENLREDFRESNRQQADDIPQKLKAINCDFIPVVGRKPKLIRFRKNEIKILARLEHDRFVAERFLQGWSLGEKDPTGKRKTSPYLVDWEQIPPDIQEYDFDAVRAIPQLMAKAGFEIYRLKK